MEVFDERGLLSRFGELAVGAQGYFGGVPLDLGVLDGAHLQNRTVRQVQIEAVLEEWVTELGAEVRRGHEVLSLTQHDDEVQVQVRGPAGEHPLSCEYLVGCDGDHSTVREAAGFHFPGTATAREMFMADVWDIEIAPRMIGKTAVPGGTVMALPLAEGLTRLFMWERGAQPRRRTEPPGFQEVAATWQRLTGEEISSGTLQGASAFTGDSRQATEYRRGRVLLSGHAAHTQSPAGGQGMHTGIQDSANLGWKLAAVVRGTAPKGLLDTYHSERHPVGQRLLTYTQVEELLFAGGDEMQPLRDMMTELVGHESVNHQLARMVNGLDVRYDVGPGDHPLLGRRMPHQELVCGDGKTSTTELLRRARGVLLDCADDVRLRQAAEGWADRVDTVTATPHENGPDSPLAGTDAVLIRPDGHVAWVPESQDSLPSALERWFGAV